LDISKINEILDKYPEIKGNLIAILHEIQSLYNYLPEDVLRYVAKRKKIPITRIYSIATFYHFFNLKPKGKHSISICLGTACHVKGSERILEEIERRLNIKEAETTEDGKFTLNAVRCIGACSLAPVVLIDKETYGKTSPKKIIDILKKYE
jgi:NADH-quinone oxidoreductase E subunit